SKGSEIIPSGRTGRTLLIASFFQTLTARTSSGPILYWSTSLGIGTLTGGAGGAFCWPEALPTSAATITAANAKLRPCLMRLPPTDPVWTIRKQLTVGPSPRIALPDYKGPVEVRQ